MTGVADGKIPVNGRRWNGREWVVDTDTIEDVTFDVAIEKYLAWYKGNRGAYTFLKYATPAELYR